MLKKIVPPLIPYITISIGLLIFSNAWIAIFSYHIGMAVTVLLSGTGIPVKQVFKSNNSKIPIITAIIGAFGGILFYLLWPLFSVPNDFSSYIQSIGLTETTWPLFMAYYIIVNPLIEEYYWRGCLGNSTKRMGLNDLMFSGYHLVVLSGKISVIWLIVVFLSLTFSAWFWRQANRASEGLLPSTVSHIAADITVIITIFLMSIR